MTIGTRHGHHAAGPAGRAGRDPLPLAGRTVLVTGVSRRVGIGHAIACRAADHGASVVAHHYRPHDVAQPWGADDLEAVMFPQGRWGEPDDAARLITWLLTDEARWITGQVISSEGGFARWRH